MLKTTSITCTTSLGSVKMYENSKLVHSYAIHVLSYKNLNTYRKLYR